MPSSKHARHGPPVAKIEGVMSKSEQTLYPIAAFAPRPSSALPRLPLKEDELRQLKLEIASLKAELSRQSDRHRRLRREIELEIEIWTELVQTGKGVKYGYARRRISQLKGSLEYRGFVREFEER